MRPGWQWTMTSAARKQLERLDDRRQGQINEALDALIVGTPNLDVKKLEGTQVYRLRVGAIRVVFTRNARDQVITVTRIADRKDVYR